MKKKQQSAYAKTKAQISFTVSVKLISAFVFTTRIVQSFYFLNTKFHAFTVQSGLCRTWSETTTLVFPCDASDQTEQITHEPVREKTNNLPMRKQRRRSASR